MKLYRKVIIVLFLGVMLWSIIDPHSIKNWFLESSPSIIAVFLIALFDRKLKLSDLSFTLIVFYFALPFVNAHYGVTNVPFGEDVGRFIGSERNMYDRLVHFASGLLGILPLREIFINITDHKRYFSYVIPFMLVMGLGALYEIGELLAAMTDPAAGITFTGTQGDLWDAPRDLLSAAVGALIAMAAIFFVERFTRAKK